MPSGFLGGSWIGPSAFAASGIPASPVPVAGAELLTNGDFAAWTGDNPDGWAVNGTETATTLVTENAGRANFVSDGSYLEMVQNVLTTGGWYTARIDVISLAGLCPLLFGTVGATSTLTAGTFLQNGRAAGSTGFIIKRGTACNVLIDNVSAKQLTLASLISTRPYASADCDISAAITRTAGTQAGLCARLDSAATPANFIIAYLDGAGNLKTDKCVAGTYTNIAGLSGAITYVAGRVLRLVCSGNNISVYYNGVQIGSTTAVSDAGIVSNVNHGKFSTYASNVLANYVAA